MNEDRSKIFNSVFSRYVESCGYYLICALSDFEKKCSIGNLSNLEALEDVFSYFPRKMRFYKNMIKEITEIFKSGNSEALQYLSKIIKYLLNDSQNTPFSEIQGICPIYDPQNRYHVLLFYYFANFMVTDLICQIVANYGTGNATSFVLRAGYNFATSIHYSQNLGLKMIKQWSVIFSLISKVDFTATTDMFSLFSTSSDFTIAFVLFQFIRIDLQGPLGDIFFEQILNLFKQLLKKKAVNNLILRSLSHMVFMINSEETLLKLHGLIRTLKRDKNLLEGVLPLNLVLLLKTPKLNFKLHRFVQTKILGLVSDKQKLPISANNFIILLLGKDINLSWLFWEWGTNPNAPKFSGFNIDSAIQDSHGKNISFGSIFMNNFFLKSDFSICYKVFKHILAYLANLDFEYFQKEMLPKFLEIDSNDPRFISLLSIIPYVNSPDFLKFSKSITLDNVKTFNNTIKPKIMKSLFDCKEIVFKNQNIFYSDNNFLFSSTSEEADQKISLVLEEWKIHEFCELIIGQVRNEQYNDGYTLIGRLISTLQFILSEEDFSNYDLIELLLSLCSYDNKVVALTAYNICANILSRIPNTNIYIIKIILSHIKKNHKIIKNEHFFGMLSMIYNSLTKHKEILPIKLVYKIEYIAFISLSSAYPNSRQIAYYILLKVNEILNSKGLISYVLPQKAKIEKAVKYKILLLIRKDSYDFESSPKNEITFESGLISHFYDLWLYFLTEIMNTLIYCNYTPIFKKIEKKKDTILALSNQNEEKDPSLIGLLILIYNSLFYVPVIVDFTPDLPIQFEPYSHSPDNRGFVCSSFHSFLNSNDVSLQKIGLTTLLHIHFSFLGPIIDVLCDLNFEQIPEATHVFSRLIRMPEIKKGFFKHNIQRITKFLNLLQYYANKKKFNGPRVKNWQPDEEVYLLHNLAFLCDFCSIAYISFRTIPGIIPEDAWAINSREVMLRYLINWGLVNSPSLEPLKKISEETLIFLSKKGPVFNETIVPNNDTLNYLIDIEIRTNNFLGNLIHFNYDVIFSIFLDNLFKIPIKNIIYVLNVVLSNINFSKKELIINYFGTLLMICETSQIHENSLLNEFPSKLYDFCVKNNYINNVPFDKNIPFSQTFMFGTEALFSTVFNLIKSKNYNSLMKKILEFTAKWCKNIRILPTHIQCTQNPFQDFIYFTPYQFLLNLVEVSELIDIEYFPLIANIWKELSQTPDNSNLVPIFITNYWNNTEVKTKLLFIIIDFSKSNIFTRLFPMFTFGYYYFITEQKKKSIHDETTWMTNMPSLFTKHFCDAFIHYSPAIHTTILFRNQECKLLFKYFMQKLKIDFPDGKISKSRFRGIIDEIIVKLGGKNSQVVIDWGNEALKWVLGCKDLEKAFNSLQIYNRMLVPYDDSIPNELAKAVSYHIEHNSNQVPVLYDFIIETFYFINVCQSDYKFAIKYNSLFFDSEIFLESMQKDISFYINLYNDPDFLTKIPPDYLVPIVRPIIPSLDNDKKSRQFLNTILDLWKINELCLIASPIKMNIIDSFPSCPDFDLLFEQCTTSDLCKALVHYATMCNYSTSAPILNSIFYISSIIISKIVNDNNLNSVAKIYQAAIRSLSKCKSAKDFIKIVCEKQPNVSSFNNEGIFTWVRSLEDVNRSLKQIIKHVETPMITITDCKSYQNATDFLYSETPIKILPFSSQDEMIQSMEKLKHDKKTRKHSRRNSKSLSHGLSRKKGLYSNFTNSISTVFTENKYPSLEDLKPLQHPKQLIIKPETFVITNVPEKKKKLYHDFLKHSNSMHFSAK